MLISKNKYYNAKFQIQDKDNDLTINDLYKHFLLTCMRIFWTKKLNYVNVFTIMDK